MRSMRVFAQAFFKRLAEKVKEGDRVPLLDRGMGAVATGAAIAGACPGI